MELTRRVGQPLAVQLVVDALKLARANPSFLDMRDAILTALDNQLTAGQLGQADHHAALAGAWGAFAKFGMGPAADCVGATLLGIVPDFDLPELPEPPAGPGTGEGGTEPGPVTGPLADLRDTTVMVELALDHDGTVRRAAVLDAGEGGDPADGDGRLVRNFVEHVRPRPPAGSSPALSVALEVDDLAFRELPGGGPDQGPDRVRAEVTFRVVGPDAAELAAARPPYFVHILAHLPSTGETTVLAAVEGELQAEPADHHAALDLTTPPAGRYQLLGAVVLADQRIVGSTVGPRLTVVP
jgi:extracellular elastinolytic metalloproteinase